LRSEVTNAMKTGPINIAYFSNQFASAQGHGIARYARRLYSGLQRHDDLNVIPVATGCDRSPAEVDALKEATGLQLLAGGRKLLPLAWILLNAPPIEMFLRESVDVTHILAPGYPVATRKKTIVTVHDLGPITHPEYFAGSGLWTFRRGIAQAVRRADAIICVSQATADELVGYAGECVRDRIQVIYEGVDTELACEQSVDINRLIGERFSLGTPFFMASGAISPRKNVRRLLEAFDRVKEKIPHHLVLTGGGGWDADDVFEYLEFSSVKERVHHLGYVSDDELQALYKAADFYVHVSLFEGFGLTLLEAMAAGCPVITSNISSLPEVAGDAALLVDPESVIEIAGAIENMALTENVRLDYAERGILRSAEFRWEDAADKVAGIYRELA